MTAFSDHAALKYAFASCAFDSNDPPAAKINTRTT
jgi:hypothetical protein